MDFNPVALIVLLCGIMSVAIAIYAWRHRSTTGAQTFAIFMGAMAVYILGYSMELASTEIQNMLFWSQVEYIGILTFPTLFLIFSAQYSGQARWINRRNLLGLFIFPILFLALKFLDPSLHLIYTSAEIDHSGLIPLLFFQPGPLYRVIVAYNLLAVTFGYYLILRARRAASTLYRKQTSLILAAAVIIYLIYGFYLSGLSLIPRLSHLDLNPFAYILWGGAIWLAIFRYRLFDLTPVARETLIEVLNDSVIILDAQLRVVDANPQAQSTFNWSQIPAGQYIEDLLPGWIDPVQPGKPSGSFCKETWLTHDLITTYYELTISALLDKQNHLLGFLLVAHDISERRKFEEGLKESEGKFRSMAETTAVGIYIYDGQRLVVVNPAFQQLTGYSEVDLANMDPINIFHPAYREVARAKTAARLKGEAVPQHYEVKVLTRNNEEKWANMSAGLITYKGKTATLGTFFDITEQKKLEEDLRASQKLYLDIVEDQSDPICRWLPDTTLTFVNQAYCDYFGQPRERLLGTRFIDRLPPETQEIVRNAVETLMKHEVKLLNKEEINLSDKKEKRWVVWMYHAIEDGSGNIVEFQSVGHDISEQKRAELALQETNEKLESQLQKVNALQEMLLEQAVRDVLTGLFNRRYLQESLEREIASASRGHYPISLIMLDMDHFKKLNDTFGHEAGDLVLHTVGQILRESTRQMDIACRFGGEEFVVIMPSSPLESAFQRAESLCKQIAALSIHYNQKILNATVSAGVAVYPKHGENGDALLRAADSALYWAKSSGRNRVVKFDESITDK